MRTRVGARHRTVGNVCVDGAHVGGHRAIDARVVCVGLETRTIASPSDAPGWMPEGEWDDEERRNDDDSFVSSAPEFK